MFDVPIAKQLEHSSSLDIPPIGCGYQSTRSQIGVCYLVYKNMNIGANRRSTILVDQAYLRCNDVVESSADEEKSCCLRERSAK